MSFRRAALGAVGAALAAVLAVLAEAPRNSAWAEDSFCLGKSGTTCRTVQVQTCTEWQINSITGSLTGAGLGSTCKTWYTTTYYYYYENTSGTGGSTTKPGLT